ncbi:MAG: hypothetical protein C0506_02715 [Anaerolinea sp.]|nr:hypothetical protein [Anaerolinea sp.]
MIYRLRISREAERYLARLDAVMQRRVQRRIDQIVASPLDGDVAKPLVGRQGLRTSRVGSLRIVYRVIDSEILVLIERIAPRGQVYRDL